MTLFIALLLLHHLDHFDPLTVTGTVILWIAHLLYRN